MFKEYFDKFCDEHGYIGNIGYDRTTKEYHIIITKNYDNAGIFMSKEELKEMNNMQIQKLIDMLHKGFIEKFINK